MITTSPFLFPETKLYVSEGTLIVVFLQFSVCLVVENVAEEHFFCFFGLRNVHSLIPSSSVLSSETHSNLFKRRNNQELISFSSLLQAICEDERVQYVPPKQK